MPRPPRPSDLYSLRIATEPRLSPDGRLAVVALTAAAPRHDGYRTSLWLVPTNGEEPRRLTLGVFLTVLRHPTHFSMERRQLLELQRRVGSVGWTNQGCRRAGGR